MTEWLRRLTRKPKVRTAEARIPHWTVWSLSVSLARVDQSHVIALVAAAGSCGGLMVKHPWPLLEISLSDFCRLATLDMNTYLPTKIVEYNTGCLNKKYPLLTGNRKKTMRYHSCPSRQLNLSICDLDSRTLHLKIVYQVPEIQECQDKIYSAPETRGFAKGLAMI